MTRPLAAPLPFRPRSGLLTGLLGSLLLLSACGGGGSSSGPDAASSAGRTLGTVTGFGSIVVDGVRYDDRRARVVVDTESGAPDERTGPVTVKLGHRVSLEFSGSDDADSASRVGIAAEVVGRVAAISPDLIIAGQIVRTNEDPAAGPVTVYEGFGSRADIRVTDRAEVHGVPSMVNGQIVIQASRIERKPTADAWVRVAGTVSNLSADGSSFSLGGLAVTLDRRPSGTRVVPGSLGLANGQRVVVWSTGAATATPSGTSVAASLVRIQRGQTQGSQQLRVSGPVTECTAPCAGSFKVGGTPVNAAAAGVDFRNGGAADLANGRWVDIRGTLDANGEVLLASRVTLRDRGPAVPITGLRGSITDYVDAANFKVRGVPVTTDASTRTAASCPTPLANGTLVDIRGRITPTQVVASSIDCSPNAEGFSVELKGTVGTVDAAARTFTFSGITGSLTNLTVRFDDQTVYDDGTVQNLVPGARVEVKGTVAGNVLTAREIDFEDAPSPGGVFESEGIVASVATASGSPTVTGFSIGGVSYAVTPQTVFVPNAAALLPGTEVKVVFRREAGVNNAIWVRIRRGG